MVHDDCLIVLGVVGVAKGHHRHCGEFHIRLAMSRLMPYQGPLRALRQCCSAVFAGDFASGVECESFAGADCRYLMRSGATTELWCEVAIRETHQGAHLYRPLHHSIAAVGVLFP